jgi:formamidopyrimidine-DNA glycosylase
MTGSLLVKDKPMPVYRSLNFTKAKVWPLMYTKYELFFDNGVRVAYVDPIRFGRVKLCSDALSQPPLSLLGHDPLVDFPRLDPAAFASMLSSYSCPIKALLLNQNSIICGLVRNGTITVSKLEDTHAMP